MSSASPLPPGGQPAEQHGAQHVEHYVGLMSGTSMDGVDGVLMRCEHTGADQPPSWHVLSHAHRPLPPTLREALMDLNTPGADEVHRSAMAAQALAVLYAAVTQAVLQVADVLPQEVRAIGAHGQTIRHRPDQGYTVQLNQPALLAELTGVDVIADFRGRDVAAGGQGAPLVPAFHDAIFGRSDQTVVVLNIGGMANLSILRPGQTPLGFDCGPGNALMDLWCAWQTGHDYDANGEFGAAGEPREDWLVDALAEPFFALPPPKSTGRDLFNADWLLRWLAPHGLTEGPVEPQLARDVQATLCELTARAAAQAVQAHAADATEVVVCGGGALNGDLMRRLAEQLPGVRVGRSDTHGLDVMQVEAAAFAWLAWTQLDVMQVEAAAFAWLAWAHVHRLPGNLAAVTGARGPRVLGALYPA